MRYMMCIILCFCGIFLITSSAKHYRSVAKIKEEDRLYNLCQTYMSVRENGDGYWLTVTELDMYDEINQRHEELNALKEREENE